MSDTNGPVRRRRIAGEGRTAPVQQPAGRRVTRRSPVARKPPVAGKPPVARKASVARKVSARKPPADRVTPEPQGASPVAAGSSRPDLRLLVPLSLLAAVALVLGVVAFVDGVKDDGAGAASSATSDRLDPSRRQATAAATSAAETIFSFRHDELDEHLAASKAVMTPAFAKEFDKIAPALTELAPQRKIVVEAVARHAAALPCGGECSTSKANVLVFVDQARLVGSSKEPTVFANRISVAMTKTKDGWRVANIRAL